MRNTPREALCALCALAFSALFLGTAGLAAAPAPPLPGDANRLTALRLAGIQETARRFPF